MRCVFVWSSKFHQSHHTASVEMSEQLKSRKGKRSRKSRESRQLDDVQAPLALSADAAESQQQAQAERKSVALDVRHLKCLVLVVFIVLVVLLFLVLVRRCQHAPVACFSDFSRSRNRKKKIQQKRGERATSRIARNRGGVAIAAVSPRTGHGLLGVEFGQGDVCAAGRRRQH